MMKSKETTFNQIELNYLKKFPKIINRKCNLAKQIIDTSKKECFDFKTGDIICVASKVVSKSLGLYIDLKQVQPSSLAEKIHERIPRKDPRLIQVIIDQTNDLKGSKLKLTDNYIGGWLPNGLFLSVDRVDEDTVLVLPTDCDKMAKNISIAIEKEFSAKVAVIISDSDGRIDKKGATQVAVGLYGINGLKTNKYQNKTNIETICDMLAAASGLLMGQRGVGILLVRIRGLDYVFDRDAVN
ncbi:coenzyme F420-0:L-glutamate ligase [Lactobacillus ultunensis]|uniref:coenzyme F420-0:L-glutamate ligase n=1 Tax=Lactobacillus ultunensis TaxID=227945 RepID=UPI001F46B177|nr:coenzyme F420-0:L-glutamate ligase [Lactobacillus ultunensis]